MARFVELDRHLNEARNRIKSTWTYRLDRDRRWVDDAKTGILQGTRKLLESTRSYLLGYATALSSKVQERLSNEKSRIAVSRNLITTTPTNRVKSAHERLDEKARRLISIPTRQIEDGKINLLDRQKRFQQDRFNHRILREYEYIGTRRDRLKNRFETEIKFIDQQLSHLSKRFSLAALLTYLGNEKTKLANKAAILRAAAPDTSLKRGFSLVYSKDGDLVKSVSQIQQSDILRTTVSDGQIISTVNQTERK